MVSTFLPDSIKYKSLISKSTSDDEVPTPGYIHEELKQLSMDPDACRQIQDALLSRLEMKSSNVKLKGLRLLKLLCERGSPNFKRDLQRRTHVVRDCLHWRSDPHPTMGDLPAKMVREAAQEAINAIFDTEVRQQPSAQPSVASVAVTPSVARPAAMSSLSSSSMPTSSLGAVAPAADKTKYMGFGRDSLPSSASAPDRSILSYASQQSSSFSSASNESRIGGFGNGQASVPAGSIDHVYQVGAKAATVFSSGLSQLKEKVVPSNQGYGTSGQIYKSGAGSSAYTAPVSAPSHMQQQPVQGIAVWDSSVQAPHGAQSSPSAANHAPANKHSQPATPAVRVVAGAWEEGLVEKITQPGGVRAIPGREEVRQLANALTTSNDNGSLLLGLLISKLGAEQWQARLKALHAFHALLRSNDTAVQEMIRKFLKNQITVLKDLATSPHASLADLSIKMIEEVNSASAASKQTAPSNNSNGGNLIDTSFASKPGQDSLFDGLVLVSEQAPQQQLPQQPQHNANTAASLFEGLSLVSDAQQPGGSAHRDVGFMTGAAGKGEDLLEFLVGGGVPQPTPPQAQVQPPPVLPQQLLPQAQQHAPPLPLQSIPHIAVHTPAPAQGGSLLDQLTGGGLGVMGGIPLLGDGTDYGYSPTPGNVTSMSYLESGYVPPVATAGVMPLSQNASYGTLLPMGTASLGGGAGGGTGGGTASAALSNKSLSGRGMSMRAMEKEGVRGTDMDEGDGAGEPSNDEFSFISQVTKAPK